MVRLLLCNKEMGGVGSKVFEPSLEGAKVEFEFGPHYCSSGERVVHVTWETTPKPIKEKMKDHVRQYIESDNLETASDFSVRGYHHFMRKNIVGERDLTVSYRWAILEVLREMGVRRKFTIHYQEYHWIVSFVHDFTELPATETN